MADTRGPSVLSVVHDWDPDAALRRWLMTVVDDGALACRADARHQYEEFGHRKRYRNTWALPATWTDRPGQSLIVQRCQRCRLVIREYLTVSHVNPFDWPTRWKMHYDDRYKPPPGAGRVTPRMARSEQARRANREGADLVAELETLRIPADVITLAGL